MKKTLIAALALVAGGALTTATAAKKDKKDKKTDTKVEAVKLETKADTLSYAAGMSRTEGLMPYLKQSFGIEEKDMADFIAGYEAYVNSGRDTKAVAYAAGQQIAQMANERMLPYLNKEFKESSDSVSAKFFNKGFVASLKKDNSVLADSVAKPYFENAVKANIEAMNMKNKKAGEDFLAANAKKEGVVTLPSGLQYKVLTAGTGEKPKSTDRVKVKYEGKTIDGKVFDSSFKRNPPTTTFGVTQVIKGWTEALQLMPVGSKWELYIPYDLAYGERGAGKDIKPYDALIFNVELVDIEKPSEAKSADAKTGTSPVKKATAKTAAKKSAGKAKK